MAQTTSAPTYQYATTSGMVGMTAAQTARLNVLSLNPDFGAAVACPVTLQFVDATNNVLKQVAVSNINPEAATFLDLKFTEVATPTMPREQIRAVVRTGPLPTATAQPGSIAVLTSRCNVFPTLEIFDNVTGQTQVMTSDFRAAPTVTPVPLTGMVRR